MHKFDSLEKKSRLKPEMLLMIMDENEYFDGVFGLLFLSKVIFCDRRPTNACLFKSNIFHARELIENFHGDYLSRLRKKNVNKSSEV